MLNCFLENFGEQPLLPKQHIDKLQEMKKSGFEPNIIFDVGGSVCHWTNECIKVWPDAKIYIFDAYSGVEFLYKKKMTSGVVSDYHIGCLSDIVKEVTFYQNPLNLGGNSYFRERNKEGYKMHNEWYEVKMITQKLDDVVREKGFPRPDLVKLDTQSSELDIIRGGLETVKNTQFMIVEMQEIDYNENGPKAPYILDELKKLGWDCVHPKFCFGHSDADYLMKNDKINK